MLITEVYIDFFVYTCYYIKIMETLTDFLADCTALSGSSLPSSIKSHDSLVRILTVTQMTSEIPVFEPKTTFGERVTADIASGFSFGYNALNTCIEAEPIIFESLEKALANQKQDAIHPEPAELPVVIYTINGIAHAMQKNIKGRPCYTLRANQEHNLIPRTVAKMAGIGLQFPPHSANAIFEVPLDNSSGYCMFVRYATSAVDAGIRARLTSPSDRTRDGLMLDHQNVTAKVDELLQSAVRMQLARE